MKIHIFGSSAGTEPQLNRHHTSWALELEDGSVYWFDAGESCSHYAYLKGLDFHKIKSVAISHPHIDHIGGLPNLVWVIHKHLRHHTPEKILDIAMLLPEDDMWEKKILPMTGYFHESASQYFNFDIRRNRDGIMYDDGIVSIEARHNFHLGEPEDGVFKSYSFRIRCNGKTIVFSGDVRSHNDMGDFLDGCDLLLMETGHHKSSEVCAALRAEKRDVKDILFIHSGRELLNDYDAALARAEAAWGKKLHVGFDGMTYTI